MPSEPLRGLHVITISYPGSKPAAALEPVLQAYAENDVYTKAEAPFAVVEPVFPEQQRTAEETDNLGIDSDILDESLVPDHGAKEPNGPGMARVKAAIETVRATGKVAAFAVVSVFGKGAGSEIAIASGVELIQHGLAAWGRHGTVGLSPRPFH